MLADLCSLVVPDGTEVIGWSQYKGKAYERVFIPKSVTEIKASAFEDCKNLREVVIEAGSRLRTLGKYVFNGCSRLRSIEIPDGVERIGNECFRHSGIEEITFPSALREIGANAFDDCKNLKTVWVGQRCALRVENYVPYAANVRRK